LSPDQFLLENDGHGHFKVVSDDRIKAFKNIGMVTDAAWMDCRPASRDELRLLFASIEYPTKP